MGGLSKTQALADLRRSWKGYVASRGAGTKTQILFKTPREIDQPLLTKGSTIDTDAIGYTELNSNEIFVRGMIVPKAVYVDKLEELTRQLVATGDFKFIPKTSASSSSSCANLGFGCCVGGNEAIEGSVCSIEYDPVCCSDTTYDNLCIANAGGCSSTQLSPGECPIAQCDTSECKEWDCKRWCQCYDPRDVHVYATNGCDYKEDTCGCSVEKTDPCHCSNKYDPVRCNGKQYQNECQANCRCNGEVMIL